MEDTKDQVEKAEVVEAEEYELTEAEYLKLQVMQSAVENSALQLQLAKERLASYTNNVAGKYSEHGKYKLIGELDAETRKGKRVLADG